MSRKARGATRGVLSHDAAPWPYAMDKPATEGTSQAVIDISQPSARPSLAEQFPVVALGTACLTALTLRRAGLNRAPMPFDWLGTSPALIRHCLDTDFAVLLDRSHYRSLTGAPQPGDPHEGCEHELYARDFGIRRVFNHNDPTKEVDYRYLTSCVDRIRDVIASDQPKLFVQLREIDGETSQDFAATCRTLDAITRQAAFLQIAVSPPQPLMALPKFDVMAVRGSHTLYHMKPTSKFGGLGFPRKVDNEAVAAAVVDYGRRNPHAFRIEDHIAPDPSPELAASLDVVRIMAHIADRADTEPDENGWTGEPGSGLAIQGIAVAVNEALSPDTVRYQVAVTPDEFSQWSSAGTYLGTRGLAQPIYGLRLCIAPGLLADFQLSVELTFTDGTRLGPIPQRRHYEIASGFPLEAVRILAIRRDTEAAQSPDADAPDFRVRCGMRTHAADRPAGRETP